MYRENPLVRQGKKIVIYGLSLLMLAVTLTACLQPMTSIPLLEQPLFQPESPLVPEEFLRLTKNPWRVVTIIHQNETVPFDAIQPIYVGISPDSLSAETTNCNRLGFMLNSTGNQQYQLLDGASTLMLCPEIQTKQYNVRLAVSETNTLKRNGTQLLLTGDDVRVVLEVENAP